MRMVSQSISRDTGIQDNQKFQIPLFAINATQSHSTASPPQLQANCGTREGAPDLLNTDRIGGVPLLIVEQGDDATREQGA